MGSKLSVGRDGERQMEERGNTEQNPETTEVDGGAERGREGKEETKEAVVIPAKN